LQQRHSVKIYHRKSITVNKLHDVIDNFG